MSRYATLLIAFTTLILFGCESHYVVPAGGVSAAQITGGDIATAYNQKPLAQFPANIAMVRVQAPGYHSETVDAYGNGRYSVVTVRDIEDDADVEQILRWPGVAGLAAMNRLIISPQLNSDRELRQAAARLQADMLLIYSVDTSFHIDEHEIGPLGVITLGTLPNHEARVTSTCSAVLFDVRSGYIYGLAEATAQASEMATGWRTTNAIDNSRLRAEREAFKKLIPELEKTWAGVVRQYAGARAPSNAVNIQPSIAAPDGWRVVR